MNVITMNHRKQLSRCALLALGGWALACAPASMAAVANVSIVDFAFQPASVTININDQVKWTWAGSSMHSSTSDTSLWDSGIQTTGATFTHTFSSAGNFPYHCVVHTFMTASVTVQAANVPPTITITNPPNGAILSAPASLTLAAAAADSDGSVTDVQFFQGTTSLGNVATAPYSLAVNNLSAADYTFSAVATDNGGATATNAITVHVVAPVPITLSVPQKPSPTSFQFQYTANAGLSYVVLRSGDLFSWTPINTNTSASSTVVFQDNNVPTTAAYYRVARLPNP